MHPVEARQNPHAFVSSSAIKPALRNYIEDNFYDLPVNTELKGWEQSDILRRTLDRVWVAEACESIPSFERDLC